MAMSLRIHRSLVFEKHFSFSGPGNAVYHATCNKLFRFRPFGIIVLKMIACAFCVICFINCADQDGKENMTVIFLKEKQASENVCLAITLFFITPPDGCNFFPQR